jgi:hypothetical protein
VRQRKIKIKADSCKNGFRKSLLKLTGIMHRFSYLIFRNQGFFYKKYLQQEISEDEFKLRLGFLMAELCPRLKKRAASFAIDSRCIDGLLADIQEDMLYQFKRWTNDEYLAFVQMRFKSMVFEEELHDRDRSLKLQEMIPDIERMNSIRMGGLILSVLGDNCSKDEKELLRVLHRFESCMELSPYYYKDKGPSDGLYLSSARSIKIFMMCGNTWEDIRTILQHEFTHYFIHISCFNTVAENWPVLQSTYRNEDELESVFLENTLSVISCLFTGRELKAEKVQKFLWHKLPLEVRPSPEMVFKKTICEESVGITMSYIEEIGELDIMKDTLAAQNMTFSLCNILDESLAYLSERYTGRTYDADKLAVIHSAIADTGDFKKIYISLDSITAVMDEECFDMFAKSLCDRFLCIWKPFWSTKEYNNAVNSLLSLQR